jgi:hypothetical protein
LDLWFWICSNPISFINFYGFGSTSYQHQHLAMQGHNSKTILLMITAAVLTAGCASVMLGSYQDVALETKCGDQAVKSQCTLSNEMGQWSVSTPANIRLHKGFDELELVCSSTRFDQHKVTISSSSNLPFYANALVGGGLGAVVDLESKAGFDYPTKITFIVKSCSSEPSQASLKSHESRAAETPVINKSTSSDRRTSVQSVSGDQEKEGNPADSTKTKPNQRTYCKQLDMEVPGCVLR